LKSNEYIPHFGDEVYIPKFSKEVCTTSFIFWWWSVYQNLAMEYISFLHVYTTSVLGHILLLLQWSIYCLITQWSMYHFLHDVYTTFSSEEYTTLFDIYTTFCSTRYIPDP
jgi:hypothetical protein